MSTGSSDGLFDDAQQLVGVKGLGHEGHSILNGMIPIDTTDHNYGRLTQCLVLPSVYDRSAAPTPLASPDPA